MILKIRFLGLDNITLFFLIINLSNIEESEQFTLLPNYFNLIIRQF